MLNILDGLRLIGPTAVVLRMLLALLCGMAVGMERSYKNRPAGIRTHILICVGATVASMTGLYLYLNQRLPTDISRIGASVVSGLGFIGAGTILVTSRQKVKGVTTAAGLWVSGIVGLALGAGFYEGGLTATLLVLVTEIFVSRISEQLPRLQEMELNLQYQHRLALDQVMRYCKDCRLVISGLRVTGRAGEQGNAYTARLSLRARQTVDPVTLLEHIRSIPEILEAEFL